MRGDFTGIFWAWLRFVALFHTALCRCAKMPWNRSNMISRKNSTSLKNDYSKLQSIKSNWRKNCKRHMNVEQQKKKKLHLPKEIRETDKDCLNEFFVTNVLHCRTFRNCDWNIHNMMILWFHEFFRIFSFFLISRIFLP